MYVKSDFDINYIFSIYYYLLNTQHINISIIIYYIFYVFTTLIR